VARNVSTHGAGFRGNERANVAGVMKLVGLGLLVGLEGLEVVRPKRARPTPVVDIAPVRLFVQYGSRDIRILESSAGIELIRVALLLVDLLHVVAVVAAEVELEVFVARIRRLADRTHEIGFLTFVLRLFLQSYARVVDDHVGLTGKMRGGLKKKVGKKKFQPRTFLLVNNRKRRNLKKEYNIKRKRGR